VRIECNNLIGHGSPMPLTELPAVTKLQSNANSEILAKKLRELQGVI